MSEQPAERDRALQAALSQIEKQFGKGAIMKMSDEELKIIDAISSGAISIDYALGIGGIPRGRITEIFGPESSGKCLTGDTLVWSDNGLETIEELFVRAGQKASCTSRVTDISDQDIRLRNEYGELEKVYALTHNNRKHVHHISLESGRTIRVTANHPLRVMDETGYIVWKKAQDITEGDQIISAAFGVLETVNGEMDELSAELAGMLIADGSLGESNHNSLRYAKTYVDERERYLQLIGIVAGQEYADQAIIYQDKDVHINSKELRERFAAELDLPFVKSAGKTVPTKVRHSGAKTQRAFLRGLFEGDCHIYDSGIEWTTASEGMAKEVQAMILGLGISSALKEKVVNDVSYYRLHISGDGAENLISQLDFQSERRQTQIASYRYARKSNRGTNSTSIPHLSNLIRVLRDHTGGDRELDDMVCDTLAGKCNATPTTLQKVIAWSRTKGASSPVIQSIVSYFEFLSHADYRFEAVTKNTKGDKEPTFDVFMPGTHSFIANGVISHNTTLVYHFIAETQRAGGRAVFIDAEHALDPEYAAAIGVNVDDLYVAQPMTGEEALELADIMARSGAVDLIAIDSVAALTPKAELDGVMGQSTIGLQARMMSQAMRKIAGNLSKTNTALIFTNQIREKVGVMFGCFHYDSRVVLEDGSTEKIGKIVTQEMDVKVRSLNTETGEISAQPIKSYFNNGENTEEWLAFEVEAAGGSGRRKFKVTANHTIITPHGEVSAEELEVGDEVLVSVPHYDFSTAQQQLIAGSLLGDGSMRYESDHNVSFRVGHGEKQTAYMEWKRQMLAPIAGKTIKTGNGFGFDTIPLHQFQGWHQEIYGGNAARRLTRSYAAILDVPAIAAWYMDDGTLSGSHKQWGHGKPSICAVSLDDASKQIAADRMEAIGFPRPTINKRDFVWYGESAQRFAQMVAPYIHPSMRYKLPARYNDVPFAWNPDNTSNIKTERVVGMPITKKYSVAVEPKKKFKYDLEIDGTHTYFVDHVAVHNSPETTPGGRALKFYSSVRIDIRRSTKIAGKNERGEDETVGNDTKVTIVKNKVAPPFRKAEFEIRYGEGISREGEILKCGTDREIIKKAGAFYSYGDVRLGQGRDNSVNFLKDPENKAIRDELEEKVRLDFGLGEEHATAVEPAVPTEDEVAAFEEELVEEVAEATPDTSSKES